MTDDQAIEIVDKAIAELREFFPDVQILCSWTDDEHEGCTFDVFRGKGNWYARTGMAREFLTRDSGQTEAHEIAKSLSDDDGEDDE